ncbi:MAG TPA: PRC-barrel domain-containing protein [Micromonosporaceae bacterium]|nr:PRC-barrel domain-containing protein [Micromonosporaceae bacterium]
MHSSPFTPWAWRESVLGPEHPTTEYGRSDADHDRTARRTLDVTGYKVEAIDGRIGSIDETNNEVGSAFLVVDTGPWIFGRKVLLPAGTVQRVDHNEQRVYVDRTKEQIKESPAYNSDTFGKPDYREQVGGYYEDTYRTAPPLH